MSSTRNASTCIQAGISSMLENWNRCCVQKSTGSQPRNSPDIDNAPTV